MFLMTNRFRRGSAPGRARSEDQRPASFKRGHKKRGGRQRGTANKFPAQYKKDIFEAAYRIGADANGALGLVGYFTWIAIRHPRIMCGLLGSLMEFQELEIGLPEKPRPTMDELDEEVRAYIGLGGNDQMLPGLAERKSAADPIGRKEQKQRANQPPDADSPWAWTGRDDQVGRLMHLAITNPKEFCTLLQAVWPRPTALQRGLVARRALEEGWRAEERRRTEHHPEGGS
jgi:hypothetical protein